MRLGGFQKLTLIDYPGKIATTVFTVGCSFRCGFCHNPELVLSEMFPPLSNMEQDFFSFLEKRKGKLDGVCITGGEPTIQPDILPFMRRVKELGYAIKLDSNGTRPDVLRKVFTEDLADYVAMDIKSSLENYSLAAGVKVDTARIERSVELIRCSGLPYEFRTTVVPAIHTEQDFSKIGEWLNGSRAYYLQEFRPQRTVDPAFGKKNAKQLDLDAICAALKPNFAKVEVRRSF